MKKIILIITLLLLQTSQSQTFEFNKSTLLEYNETKEEFVDVAGSLEYSKTIFIINEEEKKIKVYRKFKASNNTKELTTDETYYFVKKELVQNDITKYYSVNLENKKYIEIIINKSEAGIMENCNGFTGCEKFTLFEK